MKISIVMPVLNEEMLLNDTLSALFLSDEEELIIVDGGSSDLTVKIASAYTEKVLAGPRGRARQMNFGAKAAAGDVLLFLHSDCRLSPGALNEIRWVLGHQDTVAGAFDILIDSSCFKFRWISRFANLRSRLTGIAYGDQGIFLRKKTFDDIGGYADIPLMEDIELCRRIKPLGKIYFLELPIYPSPRRFDNQGVLCTLIRDSMLVFSYAVLGADPSRLARYYRDER